MDQGDIDPHMKQVQGLGDSTVAASNHDDLFAFDEDQNIVIPAPLNVNVGPGAPQLAPDDPDWERWNPWLARERDESEEVDA